MGANLRKLTVAALGASLAFVLVAAPAEATAAAVRRRRPRRRRGPTTSRRRLSSMRIPSPPTRRRSSRRSFRSTSRRSEIPTPASPGAAISSLRRPRTTSWPVRTIALPWPRRAVMTASSAAFFPVPALKHCHWLALGLASWLWVSASFSSPVAGAPTPPRPELLIHSTETNSQD